VLGRRREGRGGRGGLRVPSSGEDRGLKLFLELPLPFFAGGSKSSVLCADRSGRYAAELQQGNLLDFSHARSGRALQQMQGIKGILFIHRRGHSTFVSCRSCGCVIECLTDVSLAYHHTEVEQPRLLRCHYCNFARSRPRNCRM